MKKWETLNKFKINPPAGGGKFKIEEVVKILLGNRGLKTKEEVENFLNPKNPQTLTANELGINQVEVEKAVSRIKKAIKNKEKIIVYGDYDTDGVCATAILWEALAGLGAKVMPYLPTRLEGYGLKNEVIAQMPKDEVKLIVTVDQGIVAINQVKFARDLGIEVIITDHHLPGVELPEALAIVHTTKLAGSGVAWFLASQLTKTGLDLVTIGTITDMMSLIGVNRSIVKHGLEEVKKTKRPGLLALFEIAGIKSEDIGTWEVGFLIGPRLNAAGRMENPLDSLRLVLTHDQKRARLLAEQINQHNKERQLLTRETTLHARDLWLTEGGSGKLIFVSHESYEEGIVGLVAGKLMEEFYKPTIIVSKGVFMSRASCRSISGFNIVEALRECEDLLGAHGGHAAAAGFSIETQKLDDLKLRLFKIAEEQIHEEMLIPQLKIDLELGLEEINLDLWEEINKLAPFGLGNPEPVFVTLGLNVIEAKALGADSQHLRLKLKKPHGSENDTIEAIGFGMGSRFKEVTDAKKIDIAYNLMLDTWNGHNKLKLKLKDIK